MSEIINFKEKANYSLSQLEFLHNPNDKASRLGMGSFADVKLAREKSSQNLVAVKIANVNLMKVSNSEFFAIRNEITVHKKLNHPNIIKFHGYICEPTRVYLVLEYAENGNLYNYLQKRKLLSEHEAFRFFYQTCQAIQYLHQKDILHRDIKPENLLLDKNFNIKLCDFGWSAFSLHEKRTTFCGTYEYMAPEIVAKTSYDYRIDIWSLGVLLYELLHKEAPYKGRSLPEISASLQKNQIRFGMSVPAGAKDLILKLLKFEPDERLTLDEVFAHPWVQRHLLREKQTAACLSPKQKFLARTKSKAREPVYSSHHWDKENQEPNTQEMGNTTSQGFRPKRTMLSPQIIKLTDFPMIIPNVPKGRDLKHGIAKEENHGNKTEEPKEIQPLKEYNFNIISSNAAAANAKNRNRSSPSVSKKLSDEAAAKVKEKSNKTTQQQKGNIDSSALSPSLAYKLNDIISNVNPLQKGSNNERKERSPLHQKKQNPGGDTNPSKPNDGAHHAVARQLSMHETSTLRGISPIEITQTPTNFKIENQYHKRNRAYKNLANEFKRESSSSKLNRVKRASSPPSSTTASSRSRQDNMRAEMPTQATEADIVSGQKLHEGDNNWFHIKKIDSEEPLSFAIPFNQFQKGNTFNRRLVVKSIQNLQDVKIQIPKGETKQSGNSISHYTIDIKQM